MRVRCQEYAGGKATGCWFTCVMTQNTNQVVSSSVFSLQIDPKVAFPRRAQPKVSETVASSYCGCACIVCRRLVCVVSVSYRG